MKARLYVANLPTSLTQEQLSDLARAMLSNYGQVEAIQVMPDKLTGRPRGVAYVEMDSQHNALAAMEALNGSSVEGRTLIVNKNWGEKRESIQAIGGQRALREDSLLVAV